MHVKEIPSIIFKELVSSPDVVNVRDFATEQQLLDPRDYPDRLVVVGEVDKGIFARHDFNSSYSFLGLYLGLHTSITSSTVFDSSFAIIAGNREDGTWVRGAGALTKQGIWTQIDMTTYFGIERLKRLADILEVAGRITTRACDLLESGLFDTTSYFEGDLNL